MVICFNIPSYLVSRLVRIYRYSGRATSGGRSPISGAPATAIWSSIVLSLRSSRVFPYHLGCVFCSTPDPPGASVGPFDVPGLHPREESAAGPENQSTV